MSGTAKDAGTSIPARDKTIIQFQERLESIEASPGAYIRLSREISDQTMPAATPVTAAFLTSFNLESTAPYLVVESAKAGILLAPWFGPYGQLEQQCLAPASDFYQSAPDVVILGLLLEDAAPDLVHRFLSLSDENIANQIDEVVGRLSGLISAIRKQSSAKILLFNFAPPRLLAAGIADATLPRSQDELIRDLNRRLAEVCGSFADVYPFDVARQIAEIGIRNWHDDRLAFLGRIPFSLEAQFHLSRGLARCFRSLSNPLRKCLVVDLDNTLWGGVIGEDGIGGIQLGEEYPGSVFKAFQKYLLMLRDRGILLAIASKNNESDALQVLENHADCILRPSHFSAMEIHWNDKAASLEAIAETLNIAVSSLAFFDDNPAEREWIRTQLPEVAVIEVPDDPIQYRDVLAESGVFDALSISSEDKTRAEMYQQEAQRKTLIRETTSMEDFLAKLEMIVTIGSVNKETLLRCAQLIGKTNQFNLTARRHKSVELERMLELGAIALWVRVSDRFGDQGLAGLAIAVATDADSTWKIDTFLLSCRILNRGVETALLSCLIAEVEKSDGQEILGEYVPTPRNKPASDFYQRHGFAQDTEDSKLWRLSLSEGEVPSPDFMTLQFECLD